MSKQLTPEAQAILDGTGNPLAPVEIEGVGTGIVFTASFQRPPNPWARISEIAAKVGVPPIQHGHPATITALGADGNSYDVWEVIARVLDRLDSASR